MSNSPMVAAIAAHRAAWQAFQDAPANDDAPETLDASMAETAALCALMQTSPANQSDLAALVAYLEWWTVEEAQRAECEPEPFAMLAAIRLAMEWRQ